MKPSNDRATGENTAAGKYLLCLKSACLLPCHFSIWPSSQSAVIKYGFMQSDKPFLALLSGRIQTLKIKICKLHFPPLKPVLQYWGKSRQKKKRNFCLQTLHSRYSWEDAKKTVVKTDELCNQTSQGNAHYLYVFGLFVCLAFPLHSFSPVYLSMANCVVSSEGCSSLSDIALLIIWYAYCLTQWFATCDPLK